ncbi:MAG: VIT domain-containing protein [Bacteroidota bacterium]
MRFVICIILIYCCCLVNAQDASQSPYFEVAGAAAGAGLGLTATAAEVNIVGVIAGVTVRQTYVNQGPNRLEANYVFPGSTNAAVHGMTMIVGQRRIEGVVQRKAAARQTYEKAKANGQRASLLEQHRPNVFAMNVANILPGDTIQVELRYTELLVPEGGEYRFIYPTVVGPRYTGESQPGTTAYAAQSYTSSESGYTFDLGVQLNASMPVSRVGSPTHRLDTQLAGTTTTIRLDGAEANGGNRDFVLEYELQGKHIQTGMLLYEGPEENYFLYLAQPPQEPTDQDYPPREFVFVVDVSGSMNGFPLQVSKKLLRRLIGQLRPVDRFNIVLFAGASQTWQPSSLAATEENLTAGLDFLQKSRGGGGTQLLRALKTAYALPRAGEGLSRNFVVVTDGYISVEPEVFDLVRQNLNQANVYSFGIGSSVNRHLVEGMARIGKGRPAFVLNPSQADSVADKFRRYISEPVLTEMTLDFGDKFEAYDVEPLSLPDVSRERPLVVFGKYRGKVKGTLLLQGYGGYAGLETKHTLPATEIHSEADARMRQIPYRLNQVKADPANAALAQLWARERIRRLDDYNNLRHNEERVEEVTRLGLDYNLLTQYTSFVAVEETPVADTDLPLESVQQALPLPEDVSATAVGFNLGITGIAGLPNNTRAPWYAFPLLGLLGGLLCYLFYAVFGRRLFSLFFGIGCMAFLSSCGSGQAPPASGATTTPQTLVLEERAATITFILGEDEGTNAYYDRATTFFRYHPEEAGEYVVTDLRSLSEVHNYLRQHGPAQGAWQQINLVAHGNQWMGLSVPLHPEEHIRTTASSLAAWTPERPLPKAYVNQQTNLVVHGCSVGRDTALLLQLSRVFAGRGNQYPAVMAAEKFTLFRESGQGVERHYADYYFRATPLGKYPQREVMANRFARQHPDKPIDWDEALRNTRFSEDLQPHLYQFNVPVNWTRVYPAETAELPTNPVSWVEQEQALMQQLQRMGLSPQQFRWEMDDTDYQMADGGALPAISVRGIARLFCVLVPTQEAPKMIRLRYGV